MNYKKIGFLTGILVLILATLGSWYWISKPSYQLLLGALEPEQRASVTSYLDQQAIGYEQRDSGIWLVHQDVSRLRMELAEQGVIQPNRQGLEMFATTDYGMTEFAQKVNYQRALQAELERSIVSIDGIQQARVHLKIPAKQALFSAREAASASVILHLRVGKDISPRQVAGIQLLVASAIENLATEHVVVVNQAGKILSLAEGQSDVGTTPSEHERRLVRSAKQLLSQWVDENKVAVAASVSINNDRKTLRDEQILAGQVVRRRSNIKDGQTQSTPQLEPTAKTMNEEYIHGRRVEEVEYAIGIIERISVGIAVTAETPGPERIALIEQVLKSGLGIDSTRGDSFSLIWHPLELDRTKQANNIDTTQPIPTDPPPANDELANAQQSDGMPQTMRGMVSKWFLAGFIVALIALGIFFGVYSYHRQRQRKELLTQLKVWLANE